MFIGWKIKFSGDLFQIVSVAMVNIQQKCRMIGQSGKDAEIRVGA
ncbi:hypothetical protein [Nitrosomonas sp.]|nr:hypothetical protein [Nitrosomonas sp.]